MGGIAGYAHTHTLLLVEVVFDVLNSFNVLADSTIPGIVSEITAFYLLRNLPFF